MRHRVVVVRALLACAVAVAPAVSLGATRAPAAKAEATREAGSSSAPAPAEPPAYGEGEPAGETLGPTLTALVRMVLVLAGVLLLAYLVLHKGLGGLSGKLTRGRLVRVVDRVGLEPRKTLYVVEVAGRYYLIGATDHGISCLAVLDAGEAKSFADSLERTRARAEAAEAEQGGSHGPRDA